MDLISKGSLQSFVLNVLLIVFYYSRWVIVSYWAAFSWCGISGLCIVDLIPWGFFRRFTLSIFDCGLLDLFGRIMHLDGMFGGAGVMRLFAGVSYMGVLDGCFVPVACLVQPVSCGFCPRSSYLALWRLWAGVGFMVCFQSRGLSCWQAIIIIVIIIVVVILFPVN